MSDNISDSVAAFRLRAIEQTGADSRDVTAMIFADGNRTVWSCTVWFLGGRQVRGEGSTPEAALENLRFMMRAYQREETIRRRLEQEMQLAAD